MARPRQGGSRCTAAQAVGWHVPINYPLVGRDAFRTATGVHAAAIIKAEAKGDAAKAASLREQAQQWQEFADVAAKAVNDQ